MTQPPPTRPPADRQFSRDVAKHIDRRQVRRRMTLWAALLALASAAALYLRCGGGFGLLGIGGAGEGEGGAPRALTEPQRCVIHVSAGSMTIAGKAISRDEAVATCKASPGVDVFPTGDARHGDVEELRAALEAAGARAVVVHPPPRAPRPPGAPPRN